MANPTLDDDFESEWSVADPRSRGCRTGPGDGRPPIIHPDARIGNTAEWIGRTTGEDPVEIGPNSVVRAFATIDAGVERPTVIGRDCLVMTHAYVAHDVQTGDRVQIGPSSVIGKVDPKTMKYREIINNASSNEVPFSTVAVQVGKELWVGSARGDRIARYPADGKLTVEK